jgi:chemotaxis protein methyltransferase CheR
VPLFSNKAPQMRLEEFRLLNGFINRFCGIQIDEDMRFVAERRLGERVIALGLSSFGEYYHYLRYHPEQKAELERAVDVLTTNETYFFREYAQLQAFRYEVLPKLREMAACKRSLTIWSAGCSSGEEVYTLAILIKQSGLFNNWNVRVFGNDISRRVVQRARAAVYSGSSFRATPPEFERYFVDTSEGRTVVPSIRSMCHFGHFNLLDEARAVMVARVEAIFCRNVLIYFDQTARKNVIQTFYQKLCPGGFLMLGHSESLFHNSTAFELEHLVNDLVYRKPLSARSIYPPEMIRK